ncbi:hypothetical protein AX14_013554 [Amanita brunnescens Koide BX004]|nr:hypothetical protein AX14_013554 [Amanita brunnescens Koide BX004]
MLRRLLRLFRRRKLTLVDGDEYEAIEQLFLGSWYPNENENRSPRNLRILKVTPDKYWEKRFNAYKKKIMSRRGGEQDSHIKFLWHDVPWGRWGRRKCPLLKKKLRPSPLFCKLCRVVTNTVRRKLRKFNGFGFYLSQTPSLADKLTKIKGKTRALVLVKAVVGKAYLTRKRTRFRFLTPRGYDSVLQISAKAKVKRQGYGQYVVYRRQAALPAYVVVYDR